MTVKPADIPQWAWDLAGKAASLPPDDQLALLRKILDERPDLNTETADQIRRMLRRKIT